MWSWYPLADSVDNSLAVDSVMWHVYRTGIGDVCIPVKPVDCEVWCVDSTCEVSDSLSVIISVCTVIYM